MEIYDVLNKKRFKVLETLKDREYSLSEIEMITNLKKENLKYNLQVLVENGFVEKKSTLKRRIWNKAKHREVKRYILTPVGAEAIKYFRRDLNE